MLDLKLVGGTIVDGTGASRYRGDVGIKDGKIVALGSVSEDAESVVDAAGMIVAPGFVDIHTHYDAQIFWDRMVSVSPWHGVTTIVIGNCGFGIAPTRPSDREIIIQSLERVEGMNADSLRQGIGEWPFETFEEFLAAIEERGCAVNVGVLTGHLPTRIYVMGLDAMKRAARPDEVEQMKALVKQAMDAGALGFATSYGTAHFGYQGLPVASRFGTMEELSAIVSVLKDYSGSIFTPNIGEGVGFDDLEKILSDTNVNVAWAPLITSEVINMSDSQRQLDATNRLASMGYNITAQFSPKPFTFEYRFSEPTLFLVLDVFDPIRTASHEEKLQIYASPEFRKGFREQVESRNFNFVTSVNATVVGDGADPKYDGRTLEEIAKEEGKHVTDVALDIAIASDLEARFRWPQGNHVPSEVEPLLHNPNTLISLGDGGAHNSQLCDACIPTYLLGHWVREMEALSLEEAVRLLTSRPADIFGISDRGRLMVGRPADIVMFDESRVMSGPLRRVYDLPANGDRLVSEGIGIEAVIVNGVIIRRGGEDAIDPNGDMPGTLLRRVNAPAETVAA